MQKNNDVYWALEKKKIFMIKCAYKMEAYVGPILLLGASLSLCGKVYGTISWPPNVNFVVWKILSDIVPMRVNLASKGIKL